MTRQVVLHTEFVDRGALPRGHLKGKHNGWRLQRHTAAGEVGGPVRRGVVRMIHMMIRDRSSTGS